MLEKQNLIKYVSVFSGIFPIKLMTIAHPCVAPDYFIFIEIHAKVWVTDVLPTIFICRINRLTIADALTETSIRTDSQILKHENRIRFLYVCVVQGGP